ncbi:hypothetical protein [uncultured Algibacter sp.]|uniref:hypothetical protein n=1 Tax=uncultured Algibacter sp. TaxID=298659 RepID=UPI0026190B83|nr:hypothetical protein [uncultured Algibacter sp.]
MQTITKYLALVMLCLSVQLINAQDSIPKPINQKRIDALIAHKETIKAQERELLKEEVKTINQLLDRKEITLDEAETLKKEAAKKRALNIENRITIVDNQISLYQRNHYPKPKEEKENLFGVNISNRTFNVKTNRKPPKQDIKTSNDLLFAIGFNNTVQEGAGLNDALYKTGGSGFVELGWNWKTRLVKNAPWARVKYGFSFQWNKFELKDNQYFVQNGDVTSLETFPVELKKSKFRVTNLVFPLHFEFGPLKKHSRKDLTRYINNDQFKIGIGGYGGFRLGTRHKLKYKENGNLVKEKLKRNYNVSNFVYGLSSYIGFGDTSLYVKYDLSPLFKDQVADQNNISIGLRFDID